MDLKVQTRIAAAVLKCSPQNVVFDKTKLATIKEAITRADVRDLVNSNLVWKATPQHQSHVRARKIAVQKAKGLRKGPGSRKGKANARLSDKLVWMNKTRLQRDTIKDLRAREKVEPSTYRMLYNKIKGNYFRSRKHILQYLEENQLFKK